MKRKIDAYIEPIKINGEILNYRMYMHYNDVEYCFLSYNDEAANFASYFKRKLLCSSREMMFTDKYGIISRKDDFDSVLACVTGVEDIDRSIISIMNACMNLDIQSDLTYHLNGESYPLVRDVDDIKYKSLDSFSKKGSSDDVLLDLSIELDGLKNTLDTKQKRR